MIVKLHGTSGSGKTTVARGLMDLGYVKEIKNVKGKTEMYEVSGIPGIKKPILILGNYDVVCGGLDGIPDVNDHIRLLHSAASKGHVFYEGLLGSEYYGRIGKESEQYAGDHVFAFLDTPIETCIERVKQRRLDRGNTKPLNERNTRGRVDKIIRLRYRLKHEFGRKSVTIDHKDSITQVLDLYRSAE